MLGPVGRQNTIAARPLGLASKRLPKSNECHKDTGVHKEEVRDQMMTMNSKFWHLDPPESLRGLAEWVDEEIEVETIYCTADPGDQRAGERLSNLSVLLTSKRITDFVWTWYSECLIQDRTLTLFREEGFTGFEVKPVKARMKVRAKHPDPCDDNPGLKAEDAAEMEIPTVWELVVTGWGGVAPPESGVRLAESCPTCGHLVYTSFENPSLLIDEEQWDGSDFFIVWPLPRFIFVTDRVARFIRKHKLTGVRLQAPETLRRGPSGELSPGRLSHSMPEARARELGEPLGIY